MDVNSNQIFYKTAATAAVPAVIMLSSPQLSPFLAAGVTAFSMASTGIVAGTKTNPEEVGHKTISIQSKHLTKKLQSSELAIAQSQANEVKKDINILANRGLLKGERVTEHPLKPYKGPLKREEVIEHPLTSYKELTKKHLSTEGERSK